MNVLLVEDNDSQRFSIQSIIESDFPNFRLLAVGSYEEAIALIKQNTFHIFLLDIDLNEGDEKSGIELAKCIRANPDYSITPILFLTSYVDKIGIAVNQTHCFSYLIKPYHIEALKEALTTLTNIPLLTNQLLEFKDLNGIYYHLKASDIIFAEVLGHTLSIFTSTNRFETRDYSIQSFCTLLSGILLRCHKSYAINPQMIQSFDSRKNEISLGTAFPSIPVGRQYLKLIRERMR